MNAPTPDTAVPARKGRRLPSVLAALALPLVLAGCQLPSFYGYRGASNQGHSEWVLYAGTVIAACIVGAITAALILWAIARYRRRSDEVPRQFQYHLPLEILYTIIPIAIVLVLFAFTVLDENRVDATPSNPPVTVDVNAFQWGWQFHYAGTNVTVQGETTQDPDPVGVGGPGTAPCAPSVDCLGPGLVIPTGENVQIDLRSRDVIHGFYVPEFNFSRYAQPGILNTFDITAPHAGVFRAQCTQFCGLYHSLMFFHVVAMSPSAFQAWLATQSSTSSY
ncbi:MAG: cytochrome c oxidase subunit II [Acidimicrobiales bacterium]